MKRNEYLEALGEVAGESQAARRALLDYAMMEHRSLPALCERYKAKADAPTRRLTTLKEWSSSFEWQRRVIEFDAVQDERRLANWERRKEEVNEADWTNGKKVRRNVLGRIADLEDGADKDTTLSLFRLVRCLAMASELQRLATNEPTEIIGNIDPNTVIERELARLAGSTTARTRKAIDEDTHADTENT